MFNILNQLKFDGKLRDRNIAVFGFCEARTDEGCAALTHSIADKVMSAIHIYKMVLSGDLQDCLFKKGYGGPDPDPGAICALQETINDYDRGIEEIRRRQQQSAQRGKEMGAALEEDVWTGDALRRDLSLQGPDFRTAPPIAFCREPWTGMEFGMLRCDR